MTADEEAAFRLAARELIRDGGDEGGDIIIVKADSEGDSVLATSPPFSLLLFHDGRRGILVPKHLGDAPDAAERFLAILQQEAADLGVEHGYARQLLN